MGDFLPPVTAVLKGNISDFKAKMGEAKAEMDDTQKKGGGSFSKLGSISKAALGGIAVAAIAVGAYALKMADSYEAAHARLTTAITASGHSFSQFSGIIGHQEKAFETLGYTNAQYEEGLARLTQATNNPAAALKNMGLVANLAAARHMSLVDAANIVGKVMQGNTTVLKRYGLDLGIAAGGATKVKAAQVKLVTTTAALMAVETKYAGKARNSVAAQQALAAAHAKVTTAQQALTQAQHAGQLAIDALSKRFAGSAQAQAETFGGKMAALRAKTEDLFKNIGMWLIPILTKLVTIFIADVIPAITKVIDWFRQSIDWVTKHKVVMVALGAALISIAGLIIASLVPAFIAWAVAAGTAAAATIVAAAPFVAIIAAIALLAAAIYELVTHWSDIWGEIKQILDDAVGWIKKTFDAVWAYIKKVWDDGINAIKNAWDTVWTAVKNAFDTFVSAIETAVGAVWKAIVWYFTTYISIITGVWSTLWNGVKGVATGVWTDIVNGVKHLGTDIASAITGFAKDVYNAAMSIGTAIINGIVDALKGLGSAVGGAISGALSHVPGASMLKKVPVIGKLFGGARGGIRNFNPAGELAVLHGREAVLPLNDPARSWQLIHQSGLMGSTGSTAGGGSTTHIHGDVNVQIVTPDPSKAGAAVQDTLTDGDFLHGRN